MSELILLDEARRQKEIEAENAKPHIQGPAICLACKHEYHCVIPVGADPSKMECPACHSQRATFATHIENSGAHWTCACGNHLFAITAKGVYCPCCSIWQFGATLKPAL